MKVLGLSLLAASTVAWAACGGGAPPPPPPGIAAVDSVRDVEDGAALLSSTVTVRFDASYRLVKSDLALASFFEFSVPDLLAGEGKTTRVLVTRAEQSPADERAVILTVDRLVPTGATLRVAKKAFRKGDEGELTATVGSGLDPVAALLASTELSVTDPAIIEGEGDPPVTAADRDPDAIRDTLGKVLERRRAPDEVLLAALGRYDTIIPAELVPSPRLRAALAALTGTFAEPALASLFTNQNCTGQPVAAILFQVPPEFPELFARVTHLPDGRRVISVNPLIEGEPLERLSAILAHEAIHCDEAASLTEEVVATSFDTLLYLSFLATNPALARDGTRLAREYNIDAIALLNSGRALPESAGLLPSVGVRQALPGTSAPFRSFTDFVANAYAGIDERSPEEPLATSYVTLLAAAAGVEAGPAFNLRYLDELIGRVFDQRLMAAAIDALALSAAK
ncbi:MAG: hypothetical protein ACKVT1_19360 [Dehalococcoidia bacterium]